MALETDLELILDIAGTLHNHFKPLQTGTCLVVIEHDYMLYYI